MSADGTAAACGRVESAKQLKNGAWLHRLTEPVTPPPAGRPAPPRDWPAEVRKYAANLTPERAAELAASLGLPADALDALGGVGICPTDPPGVCWTFPETDAAGTPTGILRRFTDARPKKAMAGSKRGLVLPAGWADRSGPVLPVEGPTDAAACTAAGLAAVGRPSNTGGVPLLAEALRALPADRPVIVVGENDQKPDGSWPGRDGARATAAALAERLGRPIGWALTPDGVKDTRDWLCARAGVPWPDRGRELVEKLTATAVFVSPPGDGGPPPDAPAAPAGDKPKGPSAAELLAEIGLSFELFHDPAEVGFAALGRRSLAVRSKPFRNTLVRAYRERTGGRVPNAEAVAAALNVIEGAAVCDGPECPVFTRVAGHAGRVYLFLADKESTVIEIDAAGWRACDRPPVRFRKPAGMLALPVPEPGGDLAGLRAFVNVPDDNAFALLVGWLMGCFFPDGPFPALVSRGEQGSGKSTTARVAKRLLDPTAAAVRSTPRNEQDLMIAARNGWALAFDNLSKLPPWLSDAFCRLATGGGFSTRELYSNDDEVIFDAKRPVMLNGIDDFVTRGDLLERSILLHHPPLPEGDRRPEAEFWAAFDAAHPRLLGAVLDRVAGGLRELPGVRPDRLPRMADFALFAVACERGAGEPPLFLAAYVENQAGGHEQALEDSPLTTAVLALMDGRGEWSGQPTALLDALNGHAPDPRPRDWPGGANGLTNKLRRLAPNLRRVHRLHIEDGRETGGRSGGKRPRFVRITRLTEATGSEPSPPSPAGGEHAVHADERHPAGGDDPRGRYAAPPDRAGNGDRPRACHSIPDDFGDWDAAGDDGDDPTRPLADAEEWPGGRTGFWPDPRDGMLPD